MSVLLFAGESYYAKGGMNDFQGCFSTISAAHTRVSEQAAKGKYLDWDWWHIISQDNLDVLDRSEYQAHGCDEDCYTGEG